MFSGDSMVWGNNGAQFSTKDMDNDRETTVLRSTARLGGGMVGGGAAGPI